jgi:hypothetical protein
MYTQHLNVKGESVISKFDWAQGSISLGKLAKEFNDTTIYYVTDAGLPIEHVKLLSTEEFNQLNFDKTTIAEDLYLPPLLQISPIGISDEQLVKHIDHYLASFEECRKILRSIEIELGKLYSSWQLTPIDDLNPYTGVFFEYQKELSNQIAYKQILSLSWELFKSSIHTDSGFFKEHDKIKLTLFGLKIREIDFLNNQNRLFYNLLILQKNQITERMNHTVKTKSSTLEAVLM